MKLLPCPFCWGSSEHREALGMHVVGCFRDECTANPSSAARSIEKAIERWNTRADPVRAALAVPGVAPLLDLIHGGFRDHDIAPATQRTLDALRVLADAAKEAGRG